MNQANLNHGILLNVFNLVMILCAKLYHIFNLGLVVFENVTP